MRPKGTSQDKEKLSEQEVKEVETKLNSDGSNKAKAKGIDPECK